MRYTIVTLFPEMFGSFLQASILGRAQKAGLIQVDFVNPRDFATDKHHTTDEPPYGGGPGMVMKAPCISAAIASVATPQSHRILMAPSGEVFSQKHVNALSIQTHLVLVCGRYEGIDERVRQTCIDQTLSLGDFVLTGGEVAAMTIIDAVSRFVSGVLGDETSKDDESFAADLLEYPHYTRPAVHEDVAVPDILTGGNHGAIAEWRFVESYRRTCRWRPDLAKRKPLTRNDIKRLAKHGVVPLWRRSYVALLHYPVLDHQNQIVTSAITNVDVHDISRSVATYDLAGFFIVTPVDLQRQRVVEMSEVWRQETKKRSADHRSAAVAQVMTHASLENLVHELTDKHGVAPYVVATTAKSLPESISSQTLWQKMGGEARPVLLLLGTGWGLAESVMAQVDATLLPIAGVSGFNHLSVRSAASTLLDRLFGELAGAK